MTKDEVSTEMGVFKVNRIVTHDTNILIEFSIIINSIQYTGTYLNEENHNIGDRPHANKPMINRISWCSFYDFDILGIEISEDLRKQFRDCIDANLSQFQKINELYQNDFQI